MNPRAISRYPVPKLEDLPEDIRARMLEVQEKAGFIPNVFLTLAHRPDEFRAFFAYHDALMLRDSGLTKAEREMIVVATSGANDCLYCIIAHGAILRIHAKTPYVADQVAVNYREAEITERQKAMLEFALKVALRSVELVDADSMRFASTAFPTRTSGISAESRRSTRSPTAWRISSPCGPTTSSTCSGGCPESSDASPRRGARQGGRPTRA